MQVVEGLLRQGADQNRTLMEQMIGQTVIASDSPLRAAAANVMVHVCPANADRSMLCASTQPVPPKNWQ